MLKIFDAYVKIKHTKAFLSAAYAGGVMILGGLYYSLLEILWRGYTHPSMIVLGGVAFGMAYFVFDERVKIHFVLKCIISSVLITGAEFVCGIIVNLWLGLGVWDYSDRAFNLLGQICPLYSLFWALLSAPGGAMCMAVHKLLAIKLESERTTAKLWEKQG